MSPLRIKKYDTFTLLPDCRVTPCQGKTPPLTPDSWRWYRQCAAAPGGGDEASSAAGIPSAPAVSVLPGKGWSWQQIPDWFQRPCTGLLHWNDLWERRQPKVKMCRAVYCKLRPKSKWNKIKLHNSCFKSMQELVTAPYTKKLNSSTKLMFYSKYQTSENPIIVDKRYFLF